MTTTIAELRDQNKQSDHPLTRKEDSSVFANAEAFANSMRMARALCSSTLVPQEYRGEQNLGNALIALEISQRTGSSPLMVMQNLYVVHGRPGWSAQFIIAALNSCGRFSPLRFEMGTDDGGSCFAWSEEKATGQKLEGPKVSLGMAKSEGWYQRNGSKWQTMPQVMLRYRAASFFGKLYAPDILMGMQSAEEIQDFIDIDAEGNVVDTATGISDKEFADRVENLPSSSEAPAKESKTEQADNADNADEWPQQLPDENGELRWADSTGKFYDPELHAWSAKTNSPGVKSDGSFRARRGAGSSFKDEDQAEEKIEEPKQSGPAQGPDGFGEME